MTQYVEKNALLDLLYTEGIDPRSDPDLAVEQLIRKLPRQYNRDDIVVMIGIGIGDTGQFLGITADDKFVIIDDRVNAAIELGNPRGLTHVLTERLDRLDRG